jgi:hypothetical protein
VTELVGWEHSMKNELIVASLAGHSSQNSNTASASAAKLAALLDISGLADEGAIRQRFLGSLLTA